jgi:uncharacterized protein YaaQ
MIAIIHTMDIGLLTQELSRLNIDFFTISSVGGYLGSENVTLLINTTNTEITRVLQCIKQNCRERIESLPIYPDCSMMFSAIPFSSAVTLGGVRLFILEVESYEEV